MKKVSLIILSVFLVMGIVIAEEDLDIKVIAQFVYDDGGRRDPFWPLVTDSGSIISYDEKELSASDMMLQGILVGADETVAVINGRIVKTGDMVGAFRIERVTPTHVVLDNGQEKIEVYLKKEE